MKTKFVNMGYKSPECLALDMQDQSVLCSSDASRDIDDFKMVEDDWN